VVGGGQSPSLSMPLGQYPTGQIFEILGGGAMGLDPMGDVY